MFEDVKQNGHAIDHATPELEADPEFIFEDGKQNGHALDHATPELGADPEFMFEDVMQNGHVLDHAAPEIKADNELMLEDDEQIEICEKCEMFDVCFYCSEQYCIACGHGQCRCTHG